jgi:hypothetical protein
MYLPFGHHQVVKQFYISSLARLLFFLDDGRKAETRSKIIVYGISRSLISVSNATQTVHSLSFILKYH